MPEAEAGLEAVLPPEADLAVAHAVGSAAVEDVEVHLLFLSFPSHGFDSLFSSFLFFISFLFSLLFGQSCLLCRLLRFLSSLQHPCSWLSIFHCLTTLPPPASYRPRNIQFHLALITLLTKHPVQTEDFPVAHLAAVASAVVEGGVLPVAVAVALQDAAVVAVVVAADPAAPAGAPE